jgi:hypothetical protein
VFTLVDSTVTGTAVHSAAETEFTWWYYTDVPLEKLFAHKKPYSRENGAHSLEVLMYGNDDDNRQHWLENDGGICTWDNVKDTRLFYNTWLYMRLSEHEINGVEGTRRFEVRNAFNAAFPRSKPSHNQMVAWMIAWCSVRAKGQGFLDIGGLPQASDLGDFSLTKNNLVKHGIFPLRRTGHPEVEKARGMLSDGIAHDECWRLQVANAAG